MENNINMTKFSITESPIGILSYTKNHRNCLPLQARRMVITDSERWDGIYSIILTTPLSLTACHRATDLYVLFESVTSLFTVANWPMRVAWWWQWKLGRHLALFWPPHFHWLHVTVRRTYVLFESVTSLFTVAKWPMRVAWWWQWKLGRHLALFWPPQRPHFHWLHVTVRRAYVLFESVTSSVTLQ